MFNFNTERMTSSEIQSLILQLDEERDFQHCLMHESRKNGHHYQAKIHEESLEDYDQKIIELNATLKERLQ